MKVFSSHFVLKGKMDYKDLAPVFPEILKVFLEEIDQMPEEEDIFQMYIELNMMDLENNRKPEGYNRKGKIRMIFPSDRKEFYLKAFSKTTDLARITDKISAIMKSAGIKFEVLQNDNADFS